MQHEKKNLQGHSSDPINKIVNTSHQFDIKGYFFLQNFIEMYAENHPNSKRFFKNFSKVFL